MEFKEICGAEVSNVCKRLQGFAWSGSTAGELLGDQLRRGAVWYTSQVTARHGAQRAPCTVRYVTGE